MPDGLLKMRHFALKTSRTDGTISGWPTFKKIEMAFFYIKMIFINH